MTARDRTVLIVVAALALLGGFWFVAIKPKRAEVTKQDAALTAAQARQTAAESSAATATAAKARYASDYATVARLGKAVPVDDDVPTLVYQLQSVAQHNSIDFRGIMLTSSGSPAPATTAGSQTAAVDSAAGTTDPAAAAAASASVLPPGATVGSAGFPTMPFSFTFDGSFFKVEQLLRELDGLTAVKDDSISTKGRLLTIDGFSLAAGPQGFPQVTASLAATAYLLPADQGLTAGATATAPGATTATATTSAAEITGSK